MSRGCAISAFIALSVAGLLLALIALAFLVVSEQEVDLASLAQSSHALRPDDPAAPPDTLVTLTGTVAGQPGGLGDDMFLAPGAYLQVERVVEMYVWQEYKDRENARGTPIYEERKIWSRTTSGLGDVSNPTMPFKGAILTASAAQIGEVQLDLQAAKLPDRNLLELKPELLRPDAKAAIKDNMLYVGKALVSTPQIGDVRVSYYVLPSDQQVTVLGALAGQRMVAYPASDGRKIYQVYKGDRATALSDLGAVQTITNWLVRVLAAAAIWFGLLLFFYSSRRLVPWPAALGIAAGSVKLAAICGLPLALLTILSLQLSGGSGLALLAALGAAGLLALALLLVGPPAQARRMRNPI